MKLPLIVLVTGIYLNSRIEVQASNDGIHVIYCSLLV